MIAGDFSNDSANDFSDDTADDFSDHSSSEVSPELKLPGLLGWKLDYVEDR
jgi:hypothetical protein